MAVFSNLRSKIKKRVQGALGEALWSVSVHGKGWLCPYCAKVGVEDLHARKVRRSPEADRLFYNQALPPTLAGIARHGHLLAERLRWGGHARAHTQRRPSPRKLDPMVFEVSPWL